MVDEIGIDRAGRLVIPKEIRERFHLHPGRRITVRAENARIVLEPVEEPSTLAERGVLLVYEGRLVGPLIDHRDLREERADHQGQVARTRRKGRGA